jgi:RimJ/RimL family protein N-acetyltransferase
MFVDLKKAKEKDIPLLHGMQREAFAQLLEYYQDYDTNPAAESVESIRQKMQELFTNYYFIMLDDTPIGGIRICDFGQRCRISPIFILSNYQGKGYGQKAIQLAEKCHPNAKCWELDTILQEDRLCRLYEKLGYHKTGITHKIKDGMDIVFYEKII